MQALEPFRVAPQISRTPWFQEMWLPLSLWHPWHPQLQGRAPRTAPTSPRPAPAAATPSPCASLQTPSVTTSGTSASSGRTNLAGCGKYARCSERIWYSQPCRGPDHSEVIMLVAAVNCLWPSLTPIACGSHQGQVYVAQLLVALIRASCRPCACLDFLFFIMSPVHPVAFVYTVLHVEHHPCTRQVCGELLSQLQAASSRGCKQSLA